MTRPRYDNLDVTPSQVAKELLRLARELADATTDLEQLEAKAVMSQEQYDMLYSQAILRAGEDDNLTSADLRKAWAIKETHEVRLAAGVAAAAVKARKSLLDTIKTRITVGQSVATALKCEIDLDGVRRR
jgi:hypothetical protein